MNLRQSIDNVIGVMKIRYVEYPTKPSLSVYGQPAYRGVDNNQCSIGCLIPNSLYHRKFEELDILTILDRFPYIVSSLQSQGFYPEESFASMNTFLLEVQVWHDLWYTQHHQDHKAVKESIDRLEKKWHLLS